MKHIPFLCQCLLLSFFGELKFERGPPLTRSVVWMEGLRVIMFPQARHVNGHRLFSLFLTRGWCGAGRRCRR